MSKSPFNINHQNKDLPSKIVAGLERISEVYRALLWDHAKHIGLSPIQIQILIFIQYHGEHLCNVSSLALEFNITKPTVSDAIKALDQKGLIIKSPSTIDKRAYSVAPSKAGEALIEQLEHFASPLHKIVSQLPQKEQLPFFESLSTIIQGLHATETLKVQRTCFACRFFDTHGKTPYCKLLQQDLHKADIRLDCPEFEGKE